MPHTRIQQQCGENKNRYNTLHFSSVESFPSFNMKSRTEIWHFWWTAWWALQVNHFLALFYGCTLRTKCCIVLHLSSFKGNMPGNLSFNCLLRMICPNSPIWNRWGFWLCTIKTLSQGSFALPPSVLSSISSIPRVRYDDDDDDELSIKQRLYLSVQCIDQDER